MIRKNDYFRLGAFILLGTGMIVAVIIILGAGRYFETTYQVETYFDESVNGLEVGSPVKLRGVRVGRVAAIGFANNIYKKAREQQHHYVYVLCDINPDMFGNLDKDEFKALIARDIENGLRVRPTTLGLTGQLFLNLVFDKTAPSSSLKMDWTPRDIYIPSEQSTLSRIEGAVTAISETLGSLNKEDITSIIKDVKSIVSAISEFMHTKDGQEAGKRMISLLTEARNLLARANKILDDPAAERILPETARTIAALGDIATQSKDDIISSAAEAHQALGSFKRASDAMAKLLSDPRMDKAMANIAPTLENVAKASQDLTASVKKVHSLVNRLNGVVASEEANIHTILEDTREVMQNLKELSGDAKRYPSGIFFGKPPSKSAPDTH
ncbi:MlaD family protein [Pseudodesulfovibrio sp.]|uniref:MlaD family protein n=1 Tax=unclassified Pseudodesulfovibrio TaxID=2661612 RepID=UPI003AFFF529